MNDTNRSSSIAIVGMSALFPKAKDMQAYWQNILTKVNAIEEAPDDWATPYFDPNSIENDRIYTRKGGFLGNLAEFDPIEFSIMPNSVDGGEPDHFLALKLAKEALRDAGCLDKPFNRDKTGIILGRGTYINRGYNTLLQHGQIVDQTLDLVKQLLPDLEAETAQKIRQELKASLPPFSPEMAPGLVPNVITGRIANRLDLKGPNYVIDAACASSLIAIDAAIKELQTNRCDLVLTGGVHVSNPPQINMIFCQLGALSSTDIKPFSQGADGTLLGEGLGILALKRLEDAERDKDRIYAILRGVGTSSDGKAQGLLAPRLEGEVLALQRAYNNSQVNPQTIGMIEAHGTGMPLGDRTEIESLTYWFGKRSHGLPSCPMGSVKSMISHCLPAAGVASVIKTALALHHKILPPTLCDQPNSELGLEQSPFYINTETRPWIHGNPHQPRRAGVNAFGFGGINAHAVLEEYQPDQPAPKLHHQFPNELLVLAASTKTELIHELQTIQQFLHETPGTSLASLAYTLSQQTRGSYKLAFIAKDIPECQQKISQILEKLPQLAQERWQSRSGIFYAHNSNLATPEKTALVFPGEGSQYANMLADLCFYFPQVRAWFDFLDETFGSERDYLPSSIIFPPPAINLNEEQQHQIQDKLFNMDIASEIVFTASMALEELLAQLGVKGAVMVGHSTGENAALIASETVKLSTRGELREKMRYLNQIYCDLVANDGIAKGSLLSVGAMSSEAMKQLLASFEGRLHLAMHNCPNQAILFGNPTDIDAAITIIQKKGGICSKLPFDRAYHTSRFENVSEAFLPFYQSLEIGEGKTKLYSCMTAAEFPTDPEAVCRLAAGQWSSQVKFWETVNRLYESGSRTFIEVGPSANLTGFIKDILGNQEYLALPSNTQHQSSVGQIQTLLGTLFVHGASLNFDPLYRRRDVEMLDFSATPTANGKGKAASILELKMPIMRLSSDLAQLVQQEVKGKLSIQEVNPPQHHHAEVKQSSPPQVATQSPLPRADSTPTPNPSGFQSSLFQKHFELMQEFLGNQSRVTASLHQNWGSEEAQAGSVSAKFPLLGAVREHNEKEFHCERQFNLHRDRFLLDHTIGGQLSQYHPEYIPLPVIPFTMSMEMLSEAALALTGEDQAVVGIYDIRGYRWLALDREEISLGIKARLLPESEAGYSQVKVMIFQENIPEAVAPPLVFEGTVKVGNRFLPRPAPKPFQMPNRAPSRWSDDQLYSTGMFHGPSFQGVKHICGWDNESIEADLQVIATDHFFRDVTNPEFQIDAGLLDAAGQLVGYWVSEQYGTEFNVFPFQVSAFEQYEAPLPPESYLLCRGKIKFISDRQTIASFEFLDRDNQVIARLEGWQDRYFSVPPRYCEFRLHPQFTYLSEPLPQREPGLTVRRIDPFPEGFLDNSWSIWKRVLAHLILTAAEKEIWYSLPKGTERTDWLLARVVAKDAVRQWAKHNLQLELAPVDVEIHLNSLGQLAVHCPEIEAVTFVPNISVTNNQGCFVATVVPYSQ